jgi:YgiT-type zinc finger domain-containing protein
MANDYFCGECGEPMTRGIGTVDYDLSGLDNVILENVPVWDCVNGHRDVQIPASDSLHVLLARALIVQPSPLKGQEVRFLRKHLGYSARAFSRHLGMNPVTLSKFENERTRIPRRLDSLVRLFCAQAMCERQGHAFPEPLLPVLEALEVDTPERRADFRMERLDLDEARQLADPGHEWRRTFA